MAATYGAAARPPVTGDQLDSYITIGVDGTVTAYYGKIDGGQGLETAIAQMLAEEIDVSYERVRVIIVSHGGMTLLGFDLKPDLSFEIPIASYTFDHGRLGWEIVPPLLDRASPLRATQLRDPYGPPILFGSEWFMDEVAAATNTDPVEFRLRYLANPRDRDAVRIAAERYGWEKRPSPRKDQSDGEVVVGRGISFRRHFDTFIALIAEVRVDCETGRLDLCAMCVPTVSA